MLGCREKVELVGYHEIPENKAKRGCDQDMKWLESPDMDTESVSTDVQGTSVPDEAAVLQRMITDLSPLSEDARQRLINTVCTFLGLSSPVAMRTSVNPSRQHSADRASSFQFSEAEAPSVKQFIHDKSPITDVERVACLAYYLARYRSTPHFKTKDITMLNTESAHRPFSNTAFAVENATKTGYLVPSIKGSKQISAAGERFVEALPDRGAAKEIMERARAGRGNRAFRKNFAPVGAA